jgi:hypothetical protein
MGVDSIEPGRHPARYPQQLGFQEEEIMRIRESIAVGTALWLALGSPTARAEDSDLGSLMKEVAKITAQRTQIREQVEQNRNLKRANEQTYRALDQEFSSITVERTQIEARRPGVNAVCERTVLPEEIDAANAECEAVLKPFNTTVEAHNARRKAYRERRATVDQSEVERVAQAKDLAVRSAQIERRLEQLDAQMKAKLAPSRRLRVIACQAGCVDSSDVYAAESCLRVCFDGAGAGRAPAEKTTVYPSGSRVFRAIENYKSSGPPNPGPRTLKMAPVPPPPTR